MKCADLEGKLFEYSEGTLPPAERAAVEAHLAACAECAGLVADLGRTLELVHGLEPVPVPPAFRVAVRQRVRALPKPRALPVWRRWGAVGWGVPAAVTAAMVAFGVFTFVAPKGIAVPAQPRGVVAEQSPSDNAGPAISGGATDPHSPGSGTNPQPGAQTTQPGKQNPAGSSSTPSTPPQKPVGGSTAPGGADSNGGSPATGSGLAPAVTSPPGGLNTASFPTAAAVPELSVGQPVPAHYVYNAQGTADVADPKAAAQSLQAWAASVGGTATVSSTADGVLSLHLVVPPGHWPEAVARVRALSGSVSLEGDQRIEATVGYSQAWALYQREKLVQKDYLNQLQKTTDEGVKRQLQSALDAMASELTRLETRLKQLEWANNNGVVDVDLKPVAALQSSSAAQTAHGS